jgi:hypothetical protein
MIPRWARAVLLVLVGAIGLDFADADCAKGSWANEARCGTLHDEPASGADPTGNCACCIPSEVAAVGVRARVADVLALLLALTSHGTCPGVHPIPYRPPLLPS